MCQPNSPTRGATFFPAAKCFSVDQTAVLYVIGSRVQIGRIRASCCLAHPTVFVLNQGDQNMDRVQHLAI